MRRGRCMLACRVALGVTGENICTPNAARASLPQRGRRRAVLAIDLLASRAASCLSRMPRASHLPDALVADLQQDYSRQLYGEAGRVQQHRLRIIWPSLLRPRVLRSLTSECGVPERHKSQGSALWLHAPKNNLQTQGVWVHQPAELLHSSHADHEWVEVTHCYYSSEGVRSWTPMWFFAVPAPKPNPNPNPDPNPKPQTPNPNLSPSPQPKPEPYPCPCPGAWLRPIGQHRTLLAAGGRPVC